MSGTAVTFLFRQFLFLLSPLVVMPQKTFWYPLDLQIEDLIPETYTLEYQKTEVLCAIRATHTPDCSLFCYQNSKCFLSTLQMASTFNGESSSVTSSFCKTQFLGATTTSTTSATASITTTVAPAAAAATTGDVIFFFSSVGTQNGSLLNQITLCLTEGGLPASLTSKDKMEQMKDQLRDRYDSHGHWIGLQYFQGQLVWFDGTFFHDTDIPKTTLKENDNGDCYQSLTDWKFYQVDCLSTDTATVICEQVTMDAVPFTL